MQSIRNTTITLLFSLLAAAGLVGCNTIEGAGEDVQRAGDTVSDVAREVDEEV